MYTTDIIKSSIKLYFELGKKNIIGKERIKIINLVYDFHINNLYLMECSKCTNLCQIVPF